nr:D-alanyl-D-alanine carboxypeptidase [Bifidobacterium goeldii]
MIGYGVADMVDVVPGVLTLRPVHTRTVPDPLTARAAGTIADDVDLTIPVDSHAAQQIIDEFAATANIGTSFSIAIADGQGNIVAERDAGTPRQPASTMKTLTAFAAASTLDMGSTLDTQTYLIQSDGNVKTLVLKGNGDMLLGEGQSDPDHINGHAGLGTLAKRTADALLQRGITQVDLVYDDSLFGTDRTPNNISENNAEHRYCTPISTMAIDGGRQWNEEGVSKPTNPDDSSQYPVLSEHTAQDTAAVFAQRLADNGITVNGEPTAGTVAAGTSALASVSSAPLNEVMAFMLRHSDNTLADEFGRLTALKRGTGNSIATDTQAVADVLREAGIDTQGLTIADCSGLAPGSQVSVKTLVGVQAHNLTAGSATAAAEGLSIPGLVGTARRRIVSGDDNGLYRVKTGSLDTVTSLTGNVSRTNGGVLSFAVIVNDAANYWEAAQAINVMAAKLPAL